MLYPVSKQTLNFRSLITAAVLLFVFFLPLHLHFSGTAQAGTACACVQGTRIHLALAADTSTYVAAPSYTALLVVQDDSLWVDDWTKLEHVRGPPASLSV